jgi:lon-related putative ATP-dependent protease
MEHRKLTPEMLYTCCDLSMMDFETTNDIKPTGGTIGQERAMRAIDFGLSLESKGFNIYVLGESGTGRMTSIRNKIQELADAQDVPEDWCYVYNFKDPDVPQAISMKTGKAPEFHKDMAELIQSLQAEISKVFESKEYEKSKNKIMEAFQKRQKEMFSKLEEEASNEGFSIRKTVSGLLIVPVKQSGDPLSEDEFDKLDDEHKHRIEARGKELQERLDDVVRTIRTAEKDIKTQLQELEREAALSEVGHLIDDLQEKYKEYEKIVSFLNDVQEDILEHVEDFKGGEEQQQSPLPFMRPQKPEPAFTRYEVNVLVSNAGTKGAPCVFESNPTYFNLFGRIEHKFQYGVAITDFSMIKAGSLHRANGGYIVIDAMDLLRNIFSYDALKRAIRNREVRIEDVWEQYRLVSSTSLKPDAIPLNVKVILVGNPNIYYLLYNLDEEYNELFKVKADFDWRMARGDDTVRKYIDFIASKAQEENLLPFDREGVAKVIEHSARLAGHREKLTSKFSTIADLLRESHYWAGQDGSSVVTDKHIVKAIQENIYRSNRIEERMQEMMEEDTLIVRTSGEAVGQINGLAVLGMGDYSFGKPSRITCRTFAGRSGIVNIERETKMSGRIHEKAILIISSYLGSKYAIKKPISLSASITFEQLYEMIEGDSATCAELYVLLSSLSGVPLKQNMAVTGSMDQYGEVQPIGGVNEKIEGFYDLCKARGLDGSHGVIIPERNIKHLMLRQDVVDAVKEGKFSIYTINKMEEGLEILTGMPAGELQEDGTYSEGTINHLVMKRLDEISEALKAKPDRNGKKEEGVICKGPEEKGGGKEGPGGPDRDGGDDDDKGGPDKGDAV